MNGRSNVSLLGNLVQDIDLRQTQSGKAVASFTLAINDKDEVSYVDCVAWEQTAEFLSKYAKKGQTLYAEGKLKQNKWQDKDGNKRSRLEVIVRGAEILSKSDDRPLKQHEVIAETIPEDVPDKIDLSEIPF